MILVRFTNFTGDTVVFKCVKREYSQEELNATERPQSECCPSFLAENIACELSEESSGFLKINTNHVTGAYNVIVGVQIDSEDTLEGVFFYNKNAGLDSILIGEVLYQGIIKTANINPNIPFTAYLSLFGKGVIGFDIENVRWGLVE